MRDRRHFGRECPVKKAHCDHWKKEAKAASENWRCLTITAFGEVTTAITCWKVIGWERIEQEMQLKGMFNSVTENVKCFPRK